MKIHVISIFVVVFNQLHLLVESQKFLSVSGRNLTLNGEKVFLSGMNQAWYKYARDFGKNYYSHSRQHLLMTLDDIRQSGGNSVRIWLHATGAHTPEFNDSGYVIGIDRNLTRDMVDYVQQAQQRNILVTFALWNCAGNRDKEFPVFGLLREEKKLRSYLKHALPDLVQALRLHQGMGVWEIINEPEGCVIPEVRNTKEPCYDTSTIRWNEGAGFTRRNITLKRILRFIGLHAHVIHREDPQALVTVGSWNYKALTNRLNRRNFYTDTCLRKATGDRDGANLDLYQIHTYDEEHAYEPDDPFTIDASLYKLDKPVIIGEFSQDRGGRMTSEEQFSWAYEHGYNGAWSWCANGGKSSDDVATQKKGMEALKDKNNQSEGGRVHIKFKYQKTLITRFASVIDDYVNLLENWFFL